MKKKRISMVMAFVLAVSLCTGCGAVNTAGDKSQDTASGAVNTAGDKSQDTASGAAAEDSTEGKADGEKNGRTESRFANDDNVYVYDEETIAQYRLDGTQVRKFTVQDMFKLCWVNNEWIYYYTEDDSVWRVPIEKKSDGDHLNLKKKEKLFHVKHLSGDIYVTDSCLIYGVLNEAEKINLYKYDFQTKQSARLGRGKEFEDCYIICDMLWEDPVMLEGSLFVKTEKGIYVLDPESGRLDSIYSGRDVYNMEGENCGDSVYFAVGGQIWQYSAGDSQAVCVLERGLVQKKVKEIMAQRDEKIEEEPENDITIYTGKIFSYQNRLYFEVYVLVDNGYRTLLLSAAADDITELRHESVVADYFEEQMEQLKLNKEEALCSILGVADGKAIVAISSVTSDDPVYPVIIDLETGESKGFPDEIGEFTGMKWFYLNWLFSGTGHGK